MASPVLDSMNVDLRSTSPSSNLNGGNCDEAMEVTENGSYPEHSSQTKPLENATPADQKTAITKVANTVLKVGESWYLVDARWIKKWREYVGYDDGMWADGSVGSPGPIDNSYICQDGALKPRLADEIDYVLLPGEAWNLLVSWYGVADSVSPIERGIIEVGMLKKNIVEVYRPELKICESDCETLVSKTFSKSDTFTHVCSVAKEVFHYPDDSKCRLWTYFADYELITDMSQTLDDADVSNGDRIMIERQQPDGRWPRALVNTSSANDRNSSSGSGNTVHQSRTTTYGSNYSSGYSSYYGSSYNREPSPPGLCGLSNMGNTCFMNSALQCMSNTRLLTQYLLADKHVDEINADNPLGMQGQIAVAYARLLKEIWSGNQSCFSPREFKSAVGRFAPQFSGFAQHDSQELLAFLLDGLHEDLNRIRKKPYVELKDSDGRPDKEVAAEAWRAHRMRNDSVIVDMFQGQFKSRLTCPDCQKVSVTFDPFMFLSLPLPVKKTRQIEVTLVFLEPMVKPKSFMLAVPKRGVVKDLLKELSSQSGVPYDRLVCADVYSHRFHKIFRSDEQVSHILDRDIIFAYELEVSGSDEHLTIPVYHREPDQNPRTSYYYYSQSHALFGFPFFVTLPRSGTTYRALYNKILYQLSRFVKPEKCGQIVKDTADGDQAPVLVPNGDVVKMENEDVVKMEQADSVKTEASDEAGAEQMREENGDDVPDLAGDESEKETSTAAEKTAATGADGSAASDLFTLSSINSFGSSSSVVTFEDNSEELELQSQTHIGLDWNDKLRKLAYDDEEADKCDNYENGTDAADAAPTKIQLTDCLKLFTTEEQLGEEDPWYCPQCKEHRQAMKKFDIWKLPKVLVIHLKRFSYTRYWRDKLDSMVHFPITGLDLREFGLDPNPEYEAIYDLHAVSNHFGGMGGGHYTAYGLHHSEKKWYDFDDTNVSSASENSLVSSSAYVLFYTRRDAAAAAAATVNGDGAVNSDLAANGDRPDSASPSLSSSDETLAAVSNGSSGATATDVNMDDDEESDDV